MSEHQIELTWQRGEQLFTDNKYTRRHLVKFDGGQEVAYSSSPSTVRVPLSDPSAVDPEESLIAALSSCHMLWFLALAAKHGYRVDSYEDRAVGQMSKNEHGKLYISAITIHPQVVFSGEKIPDEATFQELQHKAHGECFIAASIRAEVSWEARMQVA